jgi:hypothetical protein
MDKSFTTLTGKFIPDSVASKFEEARQLSNSLDKQVNIMPDGELVVVRGAEVTEGAMAFTFVHETKSKLVSKWGVHVIG